MFTGIIQSVGRVTRAEPHTGDVRLVVTAPGFGAAGVALGDSVALSGCCLTVAAREGDALVFDVSNESLSVTTLRGLRAGDSVNLEQALRLSDRVGGHLVSGHVDGVGIVAAIEQDARSQRWTIETPPMLSRYIAVKGSISVDGASLTVNAARDHRFEVNLIPHTLDATNFGARHVGDRVNLEVDLLARYVERLFSGGIPPTPALAGKGDERAARREGDE